MKQEHFGFNPDTGTHSKTLTPAESTFLGLLWTDHVGSQNKVPAPELAVRYLYSLEYHDHEPHDWSEEVMKYRQSPRGRTQLNFWMREIRRMQNHLLSYHEDIPIYSQAGIGGGYWVGGSTEESTGFYNTFIRRAITGFKKANRGKKAGMVKFFTQLTFDDLTDLTGSAGALSPEDLFAPEDVVDAFLEKMLADPDKFAGSLKKIRDKFGSVLIPRGRIDIMREKAREFQSMLEEITA